MSIEISELVGANQIRVLLRIVESGSFSAAGLTLGISQPAISQKVKRLERALGCAIFRRRNLGVELTSAGEAVAHYARAMIALEENLKAQIVQNAGREKVSVGVAEQFCRKVLAQAFQAFAMEYPDVEISLVSGEGKELAKAYESDNLDFIIVPRTTADSIESILCAEPLTWLIGDDGGPFDRDPPLRLCLPKSPALERDIALDALKTAGRVWRVVFESNDAGTLEAAVRAGLGIGVRPKSMGNRGCTGLVIPNGLPALSPLEFVMRGPSAHAPSWVLAFAEACRGAAPSHSSNHQEPASADTLSPAA